MAAGKPISRVARSTVVTRVAQRRAGCEIERDSDGRKQALVIDASGVLEGA